MKLTTLFAFLFCFQSSFGQKINIDKKILKKLFKTDEKQNYKEWTTCNSDNNFFKRDTLIFFDNPNYFYQLDKCCEHLDWKFYNDKILTENESQTCKEPASSKVTKEIFKIKIKQEENAFYLLRYLNSKFIDKFLVKNILRATLPNSSQRYTTLTLIRIK